MSEPEEQDSNSDPTIKDNTTGEEPTTTHDATEQENDQRDNEDREAEADSDEGGEQEDAGGGDGEELERGEEHANQNAEPAEGVPVVSTPKRAPETVNEPKRQDSAQLETAETKPPPSRPTATPSQKSVLNDQPPRQEIITDLDLVHTENTKMRTRLTHLESTLLQSRLQLDRQSADLHQLQQRLSETTKERDELKDKMGVGDATVKLLEGRLRESEERILSFNTLLDQALDPYRQKLRHQDLTIQKLQKENELLRAKKLQLLDKALDLKIRLKTHALEHNLPIPRPTPMSPDVEVYGGKYRRLPGIGRGEGPDG
ncbi:hypothetical protein HK097_007082 [Rhizophlyctis rosea]|uniref:Uncharacterized protein n=1 Tax=Rhizophlyctis rosea TaxID=64517 RepID=A0AAD5SF91_9FUNG|nr:hypothetical protein HK097_007082 [Rhizophlyctis rosea]